MPPPPGRPPNWVRSLPLRSPYGGDIAAQNVGAGGRGRRWRRRLASYAGAVRRPAPLPSLEELRELGRPFGIEHVGVAPATVLERARRALHERRDAGLAAGMGFTYRNPDRSTDPSRAVPGARSVVVGARSYLADDEPARPVDGVPARVGRYAWVDHYAPLREGLRAMARRLRAADERAVAFADDNAIVDREVAHRAGLGWFGKNANLLLPGAGSWFVLGCVITTATYPAADGPVADGCGTCHRCLDACPTGAIVAPGIVDANRCLAWVLQRPGAIPVELRPAVGDRLYGCDDCQEACPPTVHLGRRHQRPLPADAEAWVDALDLLDADDEALLARHGRWYIAGRDPRWLRRNALVILGNTADPHDRRVLATLERYRDGGDDLLAEHARWAACAAGVGPSGGGPGVKHLLVTNDFPPKIGGIQSLLWEWWRRLPADRFAVLTSPYDGAAQFDSAQPYRIERTPEPVLLPHPWMVRRIDQLARDVGADLVVLDPAIPLGLVGPALALPYDVVLHGAEVTVPGRLPGTKQALGNVLRGARHVISAGEYAAREAERAAGRSLPVTVVPPGVDVERFQPLDDDGRRATRQDLGLPTDAELLVSISRLVPRKGFDVAIEAAALLAPSRPDLVLAISGGGRDERRLRRLAAERRAPVRFLGRVTNDVLPRLYGCADVFTMACRSRWGGLEQEGFGIVFVEAAACGVPQVAGDSGGAAEAVDDGVTGLVVRRPDDPKEVAAAFEALLTDDALRSDMALASRKRAVAEFSYDVLAERLGRALGVQ